MSKKQLGFSTGKGFIEYPEWKTATSGELTLTEKGTYQFYSGTEIITMIYSEDPVNGHIGSFTPFISYNNSAQTLNIVNVEIRISLDGTVTCVRTTDAINLETNKDTTSQCQENFMYRCIE